MTSNKVARSNGPDVAEEQAPALPLRERRLMSFEPGARRAVAALIARDKALEDLVESFPALIVALALRHASASASEAAVAAIVAGAPLRPIAEALGLPWWTRRLPAPALRRRLVGLPDGEAFGLDIANHIPKSSMACMAWIDRVAYGAEVLGPPFALWVARHMRGTSPTVGQDAMLWLTAWAWHSTRPETLGFRLLRRPWTPNLGYRRASDETAAWRGRVAMVGPVTIGTAGLWLDGGEAHGYTFTPLEGIEAFIDEAEAMGNCLDQYHAQLEAGTRRVYSIRREGRRIAVVELGPHPTEIAAPQIVQLRGPRNRSVEETVWRAAYAWLGSAKARAPSITMRSRRRMKIKAAQFAFWQPHVAGTAGTEHQRAMIRMLEAARGRASLIGTFDASVSPTFVLPTLEGEPRNTR